MAERLQTTLEELETSNEELRASNEERSSVNEELRTVNNELTNRVDDLSLANNDLKNLFANTQVAMLFLDKEFRITNLTPPAKPLFRLRDHDIGRPLDELAGRFDFALLRTDVQTVIRDGVSVERELQADARGEPQTFIMRALPYRDQQENIQGAVLTFIEITDRKRIERQLATMVAELNHRVKNALAMVQAMVSQTARHASSLEPFVESLTGRLQAMAAAHKLLTVTEWVNADLRTLAESVLGPFTGPGSDRLAISGPPIRIRSGLAVSMGLILHELATNAAKYGAWSVPEGVVALRWEYLGRDGETLTVTWEESGGPPAQEPERPGFGLEFIRQSTRYELHGDCRPEFGAEGFRCSFALPADEVTWRPPDAAND